MVAMYKDGLTHQQIGDMFDITRQRVQQIVKKHAGLTRLDGGVMVRTAREMDLAERRREAASLERFGCSIAQRRRLQEIGREMMAQGSSRERTPIGAFVRQRQAASDRRIPWQLKLWEWWSVWQSSGKWGQRGQGGDAYVMSRRGDEGPYSVDNVFIQTGRQNSSEGIKVGHLPMGVSTAGERFVAKVKIGGRGVYLGSFSTRELAEAAFAAAAANDDNAAIAA